MAYDRADWHYGGDYPDELPPENGGTHIGMFLAWCINNGLIGTFHLQESAAAVEAVRNREMTGRQFFIEQCDEKFWSEDLSEEGNDFAHWYYNDEGDRWGKFLDDYDDVLGGDLPSLYHVEDTWEKYDRLALRISERFAEFQKSNRGPSA